MPEVAATCVDSSTQSSLSCVVAPPYMPLYAFTLELELDPVGAPDEWTEYFHFDTHTFGPFEYEEPNPFAGRYTVDLSWVLGLIPTATVIKVYPVVPDTALTSMPTQIGVADFSAAFDLADILSEFAESTEVGFQGLLFSVVNDVDEYLLNFKVDTQTGGFGDYNYMFKSADGQPMGSSWRGISFPGVDPDFSTPLVPISDLGLINGWTAHFISYF